MFGLKNLENEKEGLIILLLLAFSVGEVPQLQAMEVQAQERNNASVVVNLQAQNSGDERMFGEHKPEDQQQPQGADTSAFRGFLGFIKRVGGDMIQRIQGTFSSTQVSVQVVEPSTEKTMLVTVMTAVVGIFMEKAATEQFVLATLEYFEPLWMLIGVDPLNTLAVVVVIAVIAITIFHCIWGVRFLTGVTASQVQAERLREDLTDRVMEGIFALSLGFATLGSAGGAAIGHLIARYNGYSINDIDYWLCVTVCTAVGLGLAKVFHEVQIKAEIKVEQKKQLDRLQEEKRQGELDKEKGFVHAVKVALVGEDEEKQEESKENKQNKVA